MKPEIIRKGKVVRFKSFLLITGWILDASNSTEGYTIQELEDLQDA